VIAIAVFDFAKYFIEEEVIRGREMRLMSEARRSLTKFISTISIAVFIEGLVLVFQVSKQAEGEPDRGRARNLSAVERRGGAEGRSQGRGETELTPMRPSCVSWIKNVDEVAP